MIVGKIHAGTTTGNEAIGGVANFSRTTTHKAWRTEGRFRKSQLNPLTTGIKMAVAIVACKNQFRNVFIRYLVQNRLPQNVSNP
jgi:hypothetical protein